jgi:CBS domain-containing protein
LVGGRITADADSQGRILRAQPGLSRPGISGAVRTRRGLACGPPSAPGDRDPAVRVDARDREAPELVAVDVMSENPVTMPIDAGLMDVTRAMREHTVRRMPIVNAEGTLLGIITLDDVLVLLTTELPNLGDVVQAESLPY